MKRFCVSVVLSLAFFGVSAGANLLINPSFEAGSGMPSSWSTYGGGSYTWRTDVSYTGSKCMELGGSSFALMYQRVTAIPDKAYTVSVWAKLASGAGSATLKLEFHESDETPIVQHPLPFTATSQWQKHSITRTANSNAGLVTAAIVGESGGTVLFDEVSIVQGGTPPEVPTGNPVPGDITGDHNVNIEDVQVLGAHWADPNCNDATDCAGSDLDDSGHTDNADFAIVSENWHKRLENILGVTHVHGKYYFGTEDFLNEGADRLLTLGTKVIKVWFHRVAEKYPWNSTWPTMNNLVEHAQAPYFVELFAKPFTTFILLAQTEVSNFGDGMTQQEIDDEREELYNLTTHLLNTYQDTGKTFVLQHWEGDWLIRGHYDPDVDPTSTAIAGMIDWLNARQAGVDQARSEFTGSGVKVYHAAEVNVVVKSMTGGNINVINYVVPYTNVDMVSYSSYDAIGGDPQLLHDALDFIALNTPDHPDFGDKNVYLGEYGFPENERSAYDYQTGIENAMHTALQWGCQYLVYWELYCNENYPGTTPPITDNDDTRGFWLVKPDGSNSWSWDYFHGLLNPVP